MKYKNQNSIFKRISNLILVVLSCVLAFNIYIMHEWNAKTWYEIESAQLGRSLAKQASNLVAAPLATNSEVLLQDYVEMINQGMFVRGAVLFDSEGVKYAQQVEPVSVVELIRNDNIDPLIFVEDVVYENNIIGYVKLVLDKPSIIQHHKDFNRNQLKQNALSIGLSMILAALVTRLYYKFKQGYTKQ